MAIFGIGAYWDGDDLTEQFVQQGRACLGYGPGDSPALYNLLKTIKTGDFLYIKSAPPGELRIKAVGIVRDDNPVAYDDECEAQRAFGCLPVIWLWHGDPIILHPTDPYNVQANSLYEEFRPDVRRRVLSLALVRCGVEEFA